jgi:DNA-binding transcriptional ArsR family regulator
MKNDSRLRVEVDWAPAYELVLSLICLVCFPKHSLLEIGATWASDTRRLLPGDLGTQLSRKNAAAALSLKEDDLLMLLVRYCPDEPRDAATFLSWLENLSAGDAYEILAAHLPDTGPRLPRDFAGWRDRCTDVLSTWNAAYFGTVDPAILDGLSACADSVRRRLESPPQALIEDITNGILVEPAVAGPLTVTLVPQYHERPYNHEAVEQAGIIIMYPAEIQPPNAESPPPRLMRLTHALGDESRLRILRFVADGPRTLTEVARFIGLSQPTVHHHLVNLRAAGLVRVHFGTGAPNRYSLRPHALDQLSDQLGTYLQAPVLPQERRKA